MEYVLPSPRSLVLLLKKYSSVLLLLFFFFGSSSSPPPSSTLAQDHSDTKCGHECLGELFFKGKKGKQKKRKCGGRGVPCASRHVAAVDLLWKTAEKGGIGR